MEQRHYPTKFRAATLGPHDEGKFLHIKDRPLFDYQIEGCYKRGIYMLIKADGKDILLKCSAPLYEWPMTHTIVASTVISVVRS